MLKKKKMPKYIIEDVEISSDESNEEDSDEENSDQENSTEKNSDEENYCLKKEEIWYIQINLIKNNLSLINAQISLTIMRILRSVNFFLFWAIETSFSQH